MSRNAIAENGKYCMTGGTDKTIKLWNPHKDGQNTVNEALLIKTYKGPHGYPINDIAM